MRMLLPDPLPRPAPRSRARSSGLLVAGVTILVVLGGLGLWAWAPSSHKALAAPAPVPPSPPASTTSPAPASPYTSFVASPSSEGWVRLSGHGPAPAPRTGGAMAYDALDGYSILFGGCGAHVCPLGDTWKLQAGTWTNLTSSLSVAPPPRSGATLVDDLHDGYLVLFGGLGPAGPLDDAWRFSGGSWSPLATGGGAGPSARSGASAVYDPTDGVVVLFGGVGPASTVLGDTWTYSGGTWTELSGSGFVAPSPRSGAAFAFDPSDAFTVLFGGQSAAGAPLGDTWSFVAGRWANLTPSVGVAPSARFAAVSASDPGRGGAVLYGGENASILSDSWEFTGHVWKNLGINLSASPLAREGGAGTFDSGYGYVAMFGGVDAASYRDGLWALLSPISAAVLPTTPTVLPGASDQFRASVSGGLAPYNETWSFGDGSPPVPGPSSGHTFQLAGVYAVTLTVVDSLGATVATAFNLTVAVPRLTVALQAGPLSLAVGETVTLTANASGGAPPYQYHWAGATTNCTSPTPAVLSCPVLRAGTFGFSVAVTDSQGAAASAGTNLTITGASGAPSDTSTTSGARGESSMTGFLTALAAALAVTLACGIAVVTYRAGRRREAARSQQRPLCYAVPAWSETPQEFRPPDASAETPVGPWDRP